jgi:inorganic pyrophosphatase
MIKAFVQAEAGSCENSAYNEKTLEFKRVRRVSHPYPFPYGFILNTNAEDGANLDCYIITNELLKTGTIVDCEPIGLLEQHEGDEIDHKILARLPGQEVEISPELLQQLQSFIQAIFAAHPEIHVTVGPLLSREAALDHIEKCREE